MRIKTTREEALSRAVEEFTWIVVKFCVVKPQYRSEFKVNNKFSFNKLQQAFAVVKSGKDKKFDEFTKEEYDEFKKFSKALNYTFGISSESLKPILYWYYDQTGKRVQLKISEIVEETSRTFAPIKVVNNGKLISKNNTTGKFETIASWKTKYLIADSTIWESLFTPDSNKIENIAINGKKPTKKITDLIEQIDAENNSEEYNKVKEANKQAKINRIKKHANAVAVNTTVQHNTNNSSTPVVNTTTTPVVKEQTPNNTTPKKEENMITPDDKKKVANKVITHLLNYGIVEPKEAVTLKKDFCKVNFSIDEATLEYNTKQTSDKNKVVETVLVALEQVGISQYDGIYQYVEFKKNRI